MRRAASVAGALGAFAIFVLACVAELPPPVKCGEIPAGGCPRRDNACIDPTCSAVYFCKANGTWALDRTCAPRDAAAGADVAVTPVDAGSVQDARIDVEGIPGASGGPGCESLVAPDCALGTAAACGPSCCGCEDLFVCRNEGWDLWGRCDNGQLIPE